MKKKYECYHCGLTMARSHIFCPSCGSSHIGEIRPREYSKHYCEECGNELEIWLDKLEEKCIGGTDGYHYERRHLMWHCTECGCDYENYWEKIQGGTMETPIQRKMWG